MSRVADVMVKLPNKFQPAQAVNMDTIFQICITDGENYFLAIKDQNCEVNQGDHPDPNVTLLMDSETFVDIIDGDLGGTTAYMTGRLKAEGDVMLATKLGKLFKR